ncbi:DUF58 domain-containing protein [Microbacterium suaedae]|uniref:DUF58 domain-containing protein n=1 Tax=Microbacterium suaedae TaxID=2067813 RepID=UPI000DA1924E|nr:DUF58 domain-containing protein [Microbacterium suaedae]
MTSTTSRRPARGRLVPTVRGTSLLAFGGILLVGGAAIDRVELTYLGIVLVAVVALSAIAVAAWPSPTSTVRVLHEEIVAVGDPMRVTTTVHGGTTFVASSADLVSPGLLSSEDEEDGDRTIACTVTATRRGVHRVGPLRVELVSPFGAVRRRRDIGGSDEVVAVPPVVALPSIRARGDDGGEDSARIEHSGQGHDNLIPRPYVAGDSMRRVHWRASAHHGDLMVREEERESTPTAIVLLDLSPDSWRDAAAFDTAVSACASVVARLLADGFVIEVEAADGSVLATVDSRASLNSFLTRCATIEPRGQGEAHASSSAHAGVVVSIGRAVMPVASPAPHVLLTPEDPPDPAATRGWHTATLRDDIADSWGEAIEGDAG